MSSINTLPTNWIWAKISEIAIVNPKNDYSNIKSNLPVTFVPMAAVDDVSGSITKPEIMTFEEARKGHTRFLENDVIFARITPCMENGKIAIARNLKNSFGFGSTEFHVIRAKDGILPEYIYHYVRQERFRNFAAGFMTSTVGQLRVSKDVIENAEIPLAPTAEQKRIVAQIEELFKESKSACEALNKIPEIMKKFRQSVLASAFRGELVPQNPSDEPAEKLFERGRAETSVKLKIKKNFRYEEFDSEDEFGKLPQGWTLVRLGEVLEDLQYGTSDKASATKENGIPILRMGNIQDGKLDLTNMKYISLDSKESEKYRLRKDDILINRTNSPELVGKSSMFNLDSHYVFASYLIRLSTVRNIVLPEYINYLINSVYGRRHIDKVRHQVAGQSNINSNDIREMPIQLAPINEQENIVSKIRELFSFADQIEKSVEQADKRADKIEQSILSKAFHGELVPQDPNDEPASVLLERTISEREKELPRKQSMKLKTGHSR